MTLQAPASDPPNYAREIRQTRQGVIVGLRRLVRADIQRRNGDSAVPDRVGQRGFVDQAAASDVHEDGARADVGQRVAPDDPPRGQRAHAAKPRMHASERRRSNLSEVYCLK